ncbi:MAG: MBL fold metallo-hydrolase [Calditrichaeota bacterium]|nr:MAG: MBL fold metallo-hydrolase [Calditrichota bacterium]
MKFCILASGSRGNSIFIESKYGRFLVDVGLSARQIELRLSNHEIDPGSIDAIILTHAHRDHVYGVSVFANRHHIPVYGHPETLSAIRFKPNQMLHEWQSPFRINDVHFTPFRVSHDCEPTFGYLVSENSHSLAICTDLGIVTEQVKEHLKKAQAIILESNHDPDMLMNGPYPWHLKDRIAGRRGHLSNHDAGQLLKEIQSLHLQKVVLGHLSEENNTPDLALNTVLDYVGAPMEPIIEVVEQRTVSPVYRL